MKYIKEIVQLLLMVGSQQMLTSFSTGISILSPLICQFPNLFSPKTKRRIKWPLFSLVQPLALSPMVLHLLGHLSDLNISIAEQKEPYTGDLPRFYLRPWHRLDEHVQVVPAFVHPLLLDTLALCSALENTLEAKQTKTPALMELKNMNYQEETLTKKMNIK